MTPAEHELLRQRIADVLAARLGPLFTPDMRLTFLARHPTNPECCVVVSSDADLPAAAETLLRLAGREAK